MSTPSLLVAVAAQNRREVSEHAGRCRRFLLYRVCGTEIGAPELVELEAGESFHDAPAGQPHRLDGVDVLIGASMGGGLVAKLAARGIRAALTDERDPQAAVLRCAAGELQFVAPPSPAPATGGQHACACSCNHD
ncbi:nitrogen fixation protein [Rubrivivax gelatinosus]|nr:nitrogen fixation protein [Rubrivivax gelatinosus]